MLPSLQDTAGEFRYHMAGEWGIGFCRSLASGAPDTAELPCQCSGLACGLVGGFGLLAYCVEGCRNSLVLQALLTGGRPLGGRPL